MMTFGVEEGGLTNACGRGIGGEQQGLHGSLLHPFLQTDLYFKQLNEGHRGVTVGGKKAPKEGGGIAVFSLVQLCETVNPSAVFQWGWQR